MLQERRASWTVLVLIGLVILGFSLFANLPAIHNGFLCADQATYYAMAQSIAFDGDLEYSKKDLIRYYEDFNAGPMGIFLKRLKKPAGERLAFAKNLAYPLFAAPFVRVFGPNGPVVFNALLFFLLLAMGFKYAARSNPGGSALAWVLTFLFASVAWIYALWIAPDFFNLVLIFAVLFLWLYKVRAPGAEPAANEVKPGRLERFLHSNASDYLAAVLVGIAVYTKPPNIAVLGPFLLWYLIKRKFLKSAGIILLFALSLGFLFGTNFLLTSDWNYQGGERRSFYYTFPLEKDGVTFDTAPGSPLMTTDGYFGRSLLPAKFVLDNIYFYFFGRFMGIAWYFVPALILLILFVLGKKSLDRWFLLATLAGEILIYVVIMPDNFGGGGGSLANRYFLCIYPFFFFLGPAAVRRKSMVLGWAAAAVLIGPILLTPYQSSGHPAMHAHRFPFTLFPIEKTNINNLPTNVNPPAMRQQWGDPPFEDRFLYFLNDNFNRKHPTENGWWTLGDRKADIILRTFFPGKEVVFHLLNNPRLENKITVTIEGKTQSVTLGPNQRADLRFSVGRGYQVLGSHQYRIKIRAAKGSKPYYENETSQERRWLGVFFEPEILR
jgi:hypothetical protein